MSSYLTEIPQIQLNTASNQLRFGASSGNITTISSGAPAGARTITVPDALADSKVVLSPQSMVSQATSITTAVSLNSASGVITTQSASTAGGGVSSFTFNNTFITAPSVVLVSVAHYSGTYSTNGLPNITVSSVASGSCTVNVINCHSANALSGTLKISFLVC